MMNGLTALQRAIVDGEPCFRIYTLGPAWIEWQGKPLAVFRRQARALLYRLAIPMQPVPREEICFAFWPDTPEGTARRHLSHVLCHLREGLPIPDLVRSDNELVELDSHRVWSDAECFRSGCALPDSERASAVEQAIELYRGPLLSGFSLPDRPEFDRWVIQQRSAFQRMYLDALAVVISIAAAGGDLVRAARYARRYLQVNELAEGVHRQLMSFYVQMGDRPAALHQYQDCAAALERQLGVQPLPETRAVYQAILQS